MNTPPPLPENTFRLKRSVAFADTDAAGCVHFSSLLRYVEEAEHAALKSVGLPVFSRDNGWPRVHLDIDFLHPFTFGESLEIHVWLEKTGNSSLIWNFLINKENSNTPGAFGQLRTVRIGQERKSKPFSSEELKILKQL